MAALPETANVHPATVTSHSQGAPPLLGPRKPHHAPRRPSNKVTTITVHPKIWKHALAAADGDANRIEVHDALHVTIHNTGHHAGHHAGHHTGHPTGRSAARP